MKLSIINSNKSYIEFALEAPVEYANALRRTIMSDLETEALHDTNIHINTSMLDNDMLLQRLYMIPLLKGLETSFEYEFINETEDDVNIYSHDLSSSLVENILLVSLKPKQKLHIESSSKRGIGYMNAKWSCITDLTYKQQKKIVGELTKEEFKKIKTIIPQFKLKQITNFIDTNMIFMINQICEREVFKIIFSDNFTISFSTIDKSDAKDRLLQAIKRLVQKTLHIQIKHNKLDSNDYSIPNLLMLEYPDKNFTCIKQHNLDTYFLLSNTKLLPETQEKIAQNFRLCLTDME